jgi:serine/threonine protein phosphatase 1
MTSRTFAIGDIHGETGHLETLLAKLPALESTDTVVFLGDYLDRGPNSREVIEFVKNFPSKTKAKVVALRGNHEDAWLRVCKKGWDEFVLPPGNGCLAALRSYTGGSVPKEGERPAADEMMDLTTGMFFPDDHLKWLDALPYWYEDDHAIYVHAGLPPDKIGFLHPSKVPDPMVMLWIRTESFFREYRGKLVVFGHTRTEFLPQELSEYTPDDPSDLWAYENVVGIDTGCGNGGFLTCVELPAMKAYESR